MPYYVGIANTCHDAAVAVLSPDGKILFAEAMERCFQKKRAWDLPPDHGGWIREVIETYCDPNDDFIIATPWKTRGLLDGKKREKPMLRLQNMPVLTHHPPDPCSGGQTGNGLHGLRSSALTVLENI